MAQAQRIVNRDLTYATYVDSNSVVQPLKLDIYRPVGATAPLPLVIWVHGGGWKQGSKNGSSEQLMLVDRGYAVASIDFRPTTVAPFPANIQDCKAAIRWLRANAATYNLDPARFGVWGASSGGHLVSLLGATGHTNVFDVGENLGVSSQVQAVCDWFGPTDILVFVTEEPPATNTVEMLLGGPVAEHLDLAAQATPQTYFTTNLAFPPYLIMHGELDGTISPHQSELLRDALAAIGSDHTFYIVPGGGHGSGFNTDEMHAIVTAFFDTRLRGIPSQPGLTIAQPAGGTFQLQFTAAPLWSYDVQTSTDLINWSSAARLPNIGTSSTSLEFMDSPGAGVARKFYRLRVP
jgi:acetyl esterase/lipase